MNNAYGQRRNVQLAGMSVIRGILHSIIPSWGLATLCLECRCLHHLPLSMRLCRLCLRSLSLSLRLDLRSSCLSLRGRLRGVHRVHRLDEGRLLRLWLLLLHLRLVGIIVGRWCH